VRLDALGLLLSGLAGQGGTFSYLFPFLEQDKPVREEHFLICSPFLEQDKPVREEHFLICSPFLEQDEPVREKHPDVPDRGEPRSLHPGNAHHEKQSQPEGQYSSGLLLDDLRY
jgi:hypothetical protein